MFGREICEVLGQQYTLPCNSFPHSSTNWQENNDSALSFRRRFFGVRLPRMAFFLRPQESSMEDRRLGNGIAARDRSFNIPVPLFASNFHLAQRRRCRAAQRNEERVVISLRTSGRRAWRTGINWFHSYLPSAAGGDILFGLHGRALSPARVTDRRSRLRQNLSSYDGDERRRIVVRRGQHLRRSGIGSCDSAIPSQDD